MTRRGADAQVPLSRYFPLVLILGLISLAALAGRNWMMGSMAGWYIVFGALKLLDLRAFARAYARYDLVAERLPLWGYVFPFVELALGFAFLFYWEMILASWCALIVGAVGFAGTLRAVVRQSPVPCACLGPKIDLPMSGITLLESLAMPAMAAWMLTIGM